MQSLKFLILLHLCWFQHHKRPDTFYLWMFLYFFTKWDCFQGNRTLQKCKKRLFVYVLIRPRYKTAMQLFLIYYSFSLRKQALLWPGCNHLFTIFLRQMVHWLKSKWLLIFRKILNCIHLWYKNHKNAKTRQRNGYHFRHSNYPFIYFLVSLEFNIKSMQLTIDNET